MWIPDSQKNIVHRLISVFALAGLVLFSGLGLFLNSAPPGSVDGVLSIPSGTPASFVVRDLKHKGHIRSVLWFRSMMFLTRGAKKIQAGVYRIRAAQSSLDILSDLISGKTLTMRVTVPEGFASWQIADRLESQKVCSAADFKKTVADVSAEGFLFPETYYFDLNTPAEKVRDVMMARFSSVWNEVLEVAKTSGTVVMATTGSTGSLWDDKLVLSNSRQWTVAQAVAMASLIERETFKGGERTFVSAVYHNRLNKRMRLESDPTVQFSLGYWKKRILYRDLEVKSPYNTYRRRGLPPGPICNPGRTALSAALAPANVDYLYFVADLEGGHRFAVTYKEHRQNVRKRNRDRVRLNRK